jgi:lipopolysaccharide transport system ATP-binding protein
MSIVLKAENISKQYRLGSVGSGTLKDDIARWWYKSLGKEDPLLKIGETNDRTQKGNSDYVWAIKDINFEVQQGEVLGIIGRNGAGKSTLLKILSKVTAPTTGQVKVNGRIASLLEVGTGFHPELTGRENIYLNGAILGMRKHEITKQLDEIIEFAGVERYINTPVKRYSSGMYVRLAFAVAAHLQPEILIIDEVLAVGDSEFQKKCLGKMKDISMQGRTILFVSHNIAAIQNLCQKGIFLENGSISSYGNINDVVHDYIKINNDDNTPLREISKRSGNGNLKFTDVLIFPISSSGQIETFGGLLIELHFEILQDIKINQYKIDLAINNYVGDRVSWMSTDLINSNLDINSKKIAFQINYLPFSPGEYTINIYAEINNDLADWLTEIMPFRIIEKDYYDSGKLVPPGQGNILLNYEIH